MQTSYYWKNYFSCQRFFFAVDSLAGSVASVCRASKEPWKTKTTWLCRRRCCCTTKKKLRDDIKQRTLRHCQKIRNEQTYAAATFTRNVVQPKLATAAASAVTFAPQHKLATAAAVRKKTLATAQMPSPAYGETKKSLNQACKYEVTGPKNNMRKVNPNSHSPDRRNSLEHAAISQRRPVKEEPDDHIIDCTNFSSDSDSDWETKEARKRPASTYGEPEPKRRSISPVSALSAGTAQEIPVATEVAAGYRPIGRRRMVSHIPATVEEMWRRLENLQVLPQSPACNCPMCPYYTGPPMRRRFHLFLALKNLEHFLFGV